MTGIFILLFALFALTLTAAVVKPLYSKEESLNSFDLALVFSLFIIPLGLFGYFAAEHVPAFTYFWVLMVSISFVASRRIRKTWKIKFDNSVFLTFATSVIITILLFKGSLLQRLFVNPDPFGYATVTGFSEKYGGLYKGFHIIEKWTGTPFSFNSNWDDPTQFKLLQSPWYIPDFLDKYGIANGMFLHNLGSFLGLILQDTNNQLLNFMSMWSAITVLTFALLVGISYQCSKEIFNQFSTTLVSDLKIGPKWLTDLYIGALIVLFYVANLVFIPLISEGFLNQMASYTLTVSVLYLSLKFQFNKDSVLKFAVLFLVLVLAQFVTYAQQIPWMFLALFGLVRFNSVSIKALPKKYLAASVFIFTVSVFLITMIPQFRYGLNALISSGGGGSVKLGFFNSIRAIFPIDFGQIDVRPATNEDLQNVFIDKLWPSSQTVSGVYQLRGQGFENFVDSISFEYFSLAMVFIVMATLLYRLMEFESLGLILILTVSFALSLIYLFSKTQTFDGSQIFNPYIWMRLSATMVVFVVPILVPLIYFIFKYSLGNSFNSMFGSLTLVLFFVASYNLGSTGTDLANSSKGSFITKNCPEFLNDRNYYVSDSIIPSLTYTVCGKSMEFLSDSFPSKHFDPNETRNLIYFKYNRDEKDWDTIRLGKLTLTTEISSPCDFSCAISHPGFKASRAK